MIWSGTRKVKTVGDLTADGQWGRIQVLNKGIRSYHRVGEREMSNLLDFARGFSGVSTVLLQDCAGWEWGDSELEFRGLTLHQTD